MRKKIVAGNWKMNLHESEVIDYIHELEQLYSYKPTDVDLIIFPPSIYLDSLVNLPTYAIGVGAQDCSAMEDGAYTGEISAAMLASFNEGEEHGIAYCLVGHSERRKYHKETNQLLAKKVDQLINNQLMPVYCIGETIEERNEGVLFDVIEKQLNEGVFHLNEMDFKKVIIAYEPVWAIGTGITATKEQAQEMHKFIRTKIANKYSQEVANQTNILYGGSCKPANANELFSQPDIDGGLIGGASLKPESFIQIAQSF